MGSGAMIYVPSFIKIGSGIGNLMGEGGYTDTDARTHTHTYRQQHDLISLLYFFKIKKAG
jgi:hypothetical protein